MVDLMFGIMCFIAGIGFWSLFTKVYTIPQKENEPDLREMDHG